MKRFIALLLSAIMIFSLSACKGEKTDDTTTKPQTTSEKAEEKSTKSAKEEPGTSEDVTEKKTEASTKDTKTTKTTEKTTKKTEKATTTTTKPTSVTTTVKSTTTTTVKTTTVADTCRLTSNVPCTFTNGGSSIKVTEVSYVRFEVNPNNPNQVRMRFNIYADVVSVENDSLAVDITVTNSLGEQVFKGYNYFAAGATTDTYHNGKNEVTSYANVGNGTFTLTVTQR